eukprot:GILK01030994.1.p2 GENE.GILK01030994.1~~GILK01030994.1.p2  ORF type:complete len:104 (+),score=8.96 GILK01030994.1:281-592(+)
MAKVGAKTIYLRASCAQDLNHLDGVVLRRILQHSESMVIVSTVDNDLVAVMAFASQVFDCLCRAANHRQAEQRTALPVMLVKRQVHLFVQKTQRAGLACLGGY